jgi:hypothetical protein
MKYTITEYIPVHSETKTKSKQCILKFLKSNEGEKGINRIKLLEKHSNFFNRTELARMA